MYQYWALLHATCLSKNWTLPMANACLVVLCGLPAVGKTHLANQLQQTKGAGPSQAYKYIVIDYDCLLPQDLEKSLILSDNHQQSKWKSYRGDIVRCVDVLVDSILKSIHSGQTINLADNPPEEVAEELWEKFTHVVRDCEEKFASMVRGRGGIPDGDGVCIVIDDNMYYRSMRYSYYQIARKYTLGFCQIYLHIDAEIAMSQNAKRDVKVTDDVIHTMATKMEAPDWTKHSWEEHSITISSGFQLNSIHELITKAMGSPIQPLEETDWELQDQSRAVCSESFIYQSDLILRRLVSQEMAHAKERSLIKSEMQSLAGSLQTVRQQLLDSLKSGSVCVPSGLVNMATDSSKDPTCALYQFLERTFEVQCNQFRR